MPITSVDRRIALHRMRAARDFHPFPIDSDRLAGEHRITDSGPADGIAIDMLGKTESLEIARNPIPVTREPMPRNGIRIGAQAREIALVDSRIEGVRAHRRHAKQRVTSKVARDEFPALRLAAAYQPGHAEGLG